jgi:hypothetical protein
MPFNNNQASSNCGKLIKLNNFSIHNALFFVALASHPKIKLNNFSIRSDSWNDKAPYFLIKKLDNFYFWQNSANFRLTQTLWKKYLLKWLKNDQIEPSQVQQITPSGFSGISLTRFGFLVSGPSLVRLIDLLPLSPKQTLKILHRLVFTIGV